MSDRFIQIRVESLAEIVTLAATHGANMANKIGLEFTLPSLREIGNTVAENIYAEQQKILQGASDGK